jgi:hypothetical protein
VGFFNYVGREVGRDFSRSVDAGVAESRMGWGWVAMLFAVPYALAGRGTIGLIFGASPIAILYLGETVAAWIGLGGEDGASPGPFAWLFAMALSWVVVAIAAVAVRLVRGGGSR